MLLSEIIEQIDINVPNNLPPRIKIGFCNQIQNQFYKDYPLPEATYRFAVLSGEQLYQLPDDLEEDRAATLTIDGDLINYIPYRDKRFIGENDKFFTFITGMLMINPEPKREGVGYLLYGPRPIQLNIDNWEEEPQFPRDYIEMLIHGGSERTAMALPEPNLSLARYYEKKFYAVSEKADRRMKRKKLQRARTVRPWR